MDVETWCAQNNLTKANYYYRLRRVHEVCLKQFQATNNPTLLNSLFWKRKRSAQILPRKQPLLKRQSLCLEFKMVYLAMGFIDFRQCG